MARRLVAVWPLEAFFWEFRYDLAPTAALLVGLALAYREGWLLAGAALGLGAALKWTPAASAVVFVVWLLSSRRSRDAGRHAVGFTAAFLVLTVPYLAVWPARVLEAYPNQANRGINGLSLPYQALRLLGRANLLPGGAPWTDPVVPGWAEPAAGSASRPSAWPRCLPSWCTCAGAAFGRRRRCPGAGRVPADEPDLQPAVPRHRRRRGRSGCRARSGRSGRELLVFAPLILARRSPTSSSIRGTRPTFWWVAAGTLFLLAGVSTVWLLARAAQPDRLTGSSLHLGTADAELTVQ